MGTHYPNTADIRRDWLLVDLAGLTVGRAASQIANILRGKHKATFTPHLDVGDFVVCINAEKVVLSGTKLDDKLYRFNSGFPGGLKETSARNMLAKKPEEVIKIAVRRMLPRSPLGRSTYSKLKVYAGGEHPHDAQQPKPFTLPHS
jgi:large subunit ribosomal protein L13